MTSLIAIIVTSIILALISLIGAFSFLLSEKKFSGILLPMIAFSAGGLLGGAFFHLLPEAVDKIGNNTSVYIWVMIGFVLFFILEQFIHFHHCRSETKNHFSPASYLSLVADNLHNFVDGITIAAAFIIDFRLGIATALAVIVHEIPHELGNFSILIHGGWQRSSALLFNFISSISFLIGGVATFVLSGALDVKYLLPFAAGNFIYIAASDLVPEIHKDCHFVKKNLVHFFAFILGIALLLVLKIYVGE